MVVIKRSPFFVFVLSEQPALVISFIIWRVFNIRLQKSFKSASSSFLFYTFGAGTKFKFLFKSLNSVLINECLVKLIKFPFGSD